LENRLEALATNIKTVALTIMLVVVYSKYVDDGKNTMEVRSVCLCHNVSE